MTAHSRFEDFEKSEREIDNKGARITPTRPWEQESEVQE